MVNRESMIATGQLPNLEEDMFKLRDDEYYLIPTAEMPLTNTVAGEIVAEKTLPIRVTALSGCPAEAMLSRPGLRSMTSRYPWAVFGVAPLVIPVDREACDRLLAAGAPFVRVPTAERREHSVEMQLPMLQRALGAFALVPLVVGEMDDEAYRAAGAALRDLMGDRTLVVASVSGAASTLTATLVTGD